MVGGLIRLVVDKVVKGADKVKEQKVHKGILFCSGMIAGEGLVGILLAVLAVFGVDKVIDISGLLNLPPVVSSIGGLVVFALIILTVLKFSLWRKQKKSK